MQRTFLVALEVSDTSPSSLDGQAADIMDSLQDDGFPVISVKPWDARSGTPSELDQPPGMSLSQERLF